MSTSIKILCLHGKGANGNMFLKKLQPLIKASTNIGNFDWSFIDAPHSLQTGGFQWWTLPDGVRSFDAMEYPGIEKSFEVIQKEYPFDVILGHSQGSMLASILLSRIDTYSSVKAAILSGAAFPKPFTKQIENSPFLTTRRLKTLHVIAENDAVNPPADAYRLCTLFRGNDFIHSGGHVFPVTPDAIDKYCHFLREVAVIRDHVI